MTIDDGAARRPAADPRESAAHEQHPQRSPPRVRRHGGGLRRRPTASSKTSSSSRATPTRRSSSTRVVARAHAGREADRSGLDADAALPASHRVASAADASLARARHRAAGRRRFRRQDRAVRARARRGAISRCKTGRPVKITLTREEVFYAHRGRHPVKMQAAHGREAATARSPRAICRRGSTAARTDRYGVATTYYTGALTTVTYKIPAYKFDGIRVFTNKPPCGPKRGHGTTQPRFAFECQLDKIADALGSRRGRLSQTDRRRSEYARP